MPFFKPFDPLDPDTLRRVAPGSEAHLDLDNIGVDVRVDDASQLLHGISHDSGPVLACGAPMDASRKIATSPPVVVRDHPNHAWCQECLRPVRAALEHDSSWTVSTLLYLHAVLDGDLHDPLTMVGLEEVAISVQGMLGQANGLMTFADDLRLHRDRDEELTALVAPVAEELVALSASFHGEKAAPGGRPSSFSDRTLVALADRLSGFGLSGGLRELLTGLNGRDDLAEVEVRVSDVQLERARGRFMQMRSVPGPRVLTGTTSMPLRVKGADSPLARRALSTLVIGDGSAVLVEHSLELDDQTEAHELPQDPSSVRAIMETFEVLSTDSDARTAIRAAIALET